MNDPLPFLGFTTTPLELVSFTLSVITVGLTIRRIHWAWLFSIASSATYAVVFFKSRLYGDMGLQFVFIAVSVWGWHQWLRGGEQGRDLPVSRLSTRSMVASAIGLVLVFAMLSYFLDTYTDSDVPHADGFLTAGSILGQLLLSRKKVENWHVWIVVDILYVALYLYKDLVLTAILYGVFVLMAIAGLQAWKRAMAEQAGARPA